MMNTTSHTGAESRWRFGDAQANYSRSQAEKRLHKQAVEKSCIKWFERYADKYGARLL